MKVCVCMCVCVCACLLLYNHVYGCACTDVGGASMSVLERLNALSACICKRVCARTRIYVPRTAEESFSKSCLVALVFTMSL